MPDDTHDADGDGLDTDGSADGTTVRRLQFASWGDRFVAWLVDVIVGGAVVAAVGEVLGVLSVFTGSPGTPFLGVSGLGLWLYWTLLEGSRGQSVGKMVLGIAVTDRRGDDIGYGAAAVESFGKAFLLPIDALVGWVFMDGEYVRLFNKLSGTIVVEVTDRDETPEGVEYVKPGG